MKRLFAALMVLVLTACVSAPATPAAGTLKTVRIGYVPVLIYAPLYVGIERGYFAAEGITIESTPIQGGSDAVVQLAAGNFDAAMGGAGAGLFNAAARGVKFSIVAPMHSEKPPITSPLVISAARTGEITKVADLKGKKVAINATGAATEYWLNEALGQGGLTIDEVAAALDAPARPLFLGRKACLPSGRLNAGLIEAPTLHAALEQAPRDRRAATTFLSAWWPEDPATTPPADSRVVAVVDERDWRGQVVVGRRLVRQGRVNPPLASAEVAHV